MSQEGEKESRTNHPNITGTETNELPVSNSRASSELGYEVSVTDMPIHMFCGTFNVNGKVPDDLTEWLLKDNDSKENDDWFKPKIEETFPDIFAIGIEEAVTLNALMYANKVLTGKATIWEEKIRDTINQFGFKYRLIASRQLVGILLIIYVRNTIYPFISEVDYDTEGVGFLGVGGNKGGVAVRFRIYDSAICLVVSHLAAHKNKAKKRNKNFKEIWDNIDFDWRDGTKTEIYHIQNHDFIFWMGDLNYRLDLEDIDEVFDLVEAKDWEKKEDSKLLRNDQLLKLVNQTNGTVNNPITLFQEGVINFRPTYKIKIGTLNYLRVNTKAKRFPAWCDRILWKSQSDDQKVVQRFYRRAQLPWSDHLPVSSMFKIDCSQEDDVTEFQGGLFFSGVVWELIEILHFHLLHAQLLLPIDDSAIIWFEHLCALGGAITHNFVDVLQNTTVSNLADIATDLDDISPDVQLSNLQNHHCKDQTGMHRFTDCICDVTEQALFRNSLYTLLASFAVPVGIYLLYMLFRFPGKRLNSWFRTYQSKEGPLQKMVGAILEIFFIWLYILSATSTFEIKRWIVLKNDYYSDIAGDYISNSVVFGLTAIIVFICCWVVAPCIYYRHFKNDDAYLTVYRRSDLRRIYGSLVCDYRREHRAFFLIKIAYFLLLGIIVSGFSPIFLKHSMDPYKNEDPANTFVQIIFLLLVQTIYSGILIVRNPFLHRGYYRFSCAIQILKILSFIFAFVGYFEKLKLARKGTLILLSMMPAIWFIYIILIFSKRTYFWLKAHTKKCCCPRKNNEYEETIERIKRRSLMGIDLAVEEDSDQDEEGEDHNEKTMNNSIEMVTKP